jgi:hypothetical protein
VQFHSRDQIGKAGERLVEAFVEEQLGFTYRKIGPPDIGIDGEIETLNRDRSSTGGFLKVQVRTTEESFSGRSIRVQFDEKHLDYFDSLTVTPILMAVSLKDNAIWWKPILNKENYKGPKGGFGIPFDAVKDRLTIQSRAQLSLVAERSNAMIAKYLLEEIGQRLDDFDESEESEDFDIVTVDLWAGQLQLIDRRMKDARCLLKYERRNSREVKRIEREFKIIKDRIDIRKAWFKEWEVDDFLTTPRGWDDY